MIYPKPKTVNSEIDLKLGIKSSLPNAKQAIVLAYLIWKCEDKASQVKYSKPDGDGLTLQDDLFSKIVKLMRSNIEQFDDKLFKTHISNNPLLKAQIEALIVGFELVWKIARFKFVDGSSFSSERTGGKRFEKIISYTSNIDILNLLVQSNEKGFVTLFYEIITNQTVSETKYFDSFRKLITVFSETAVYKIKSDTGDLIFDNLGIYKSFFADSVVNLTGTEENKGSSRILKSSITEGLNYYLTSGNDGFVKDSTHSNELDSYAERVENFLSLTQIKVSYDDKNIIENESHKVAEFSLIPSPSIPFPHNRIVFGAPGTGKSHSLKENSSFFENQDIVEDESIKIKNQYTLCNTYGDFVRLGMLYADYFKEKTVSQIEEELKSKRAYWIKKGSVLKNELNDIPNYTEEEFSEKVVDFIKNIPHGKKETLGVALGYNYSNLFSDVSIETLQEEYQAVPTVAYWIVYGVQAAQSNIDKESNSKTKFIERVTFHPNYSYSQFVGTYKPVQDFVDEKQITYQYVPGPFMRIYAAAKQNPSQNFLLIIEEINRANVAAVFGDIFQLLDRKANGESEYPVAASEDIKKYLAKNGIYEDELSIPSNMYLWATMNSADQGVFPMDTAFKRRWEFEYIGIDDNEGNVQEYEIPINSNKKVNWNELRKAINDKLIELRVNEDKLLGPFFLSKNILENALNDIESFIKLFKSKVIMYLFEDAAKLKAKQLFKIDSNKYIFSEICKQFDEKGLDIFGIDPSIVKISDITGKNIDDSKNNSSDFSLLQ